MISPVQLIHGDGKAETQEAVVVTRPTQRTTLATERVTGASNENEHSYAHLFHNFGKECYLITHGADYTVAYSVENGKERWRLGGLNPQGQSYHPTLRFVASPAAAEGIVVCPTAKNGPVFAIDAGKTGDLTDSKAVLWVREDNTPDVPSPVIHDDLVYLCRKWHVTCA